MGLTDKKTSEFHLVNSANSLHHVPLLKNSAPAGEQNQIIPWEEFKTSIGISNNQWASAGSYTHAQIIAGTAINANTRDIQILIAPQYHAITSIMTRQDSDFSGGGVSYCSLTLLNNINEIVVDNLLDDLTSGAANKKIKIISNIVHVDNSNLLESTGLQYKIRFASDTPVANLTAGGFTIFYKIERTIP